MDEKFLETIYNMKIEICHRYDWCFKGCPFDNTVKMFGCVCTDLNNDAYIDYIIEKYKELIGEPPLKRNISFDTVDILKVFGEENV